MNWDSPLWNIFYVAAVATLLGYAYYSRNEQIQKFTVCYFLGFIISNLVMHTDFEALVGIVADICCIGYSLHVVRLDQSKRELINIPIIFLCILIWDIAAIIIDMAWLPDQIGNNILAMAILIILSFYGRRYGLKARESGEDRSDPYYRVFCACRLMLKT